ncbi:MAG: hypothetical protein ACOC41_00545 [Chitinivibrionales bacterium]
MARTSMIIIFLALCINVSAQTPSSDTSAQAYEFDWRLQFSGVADNREYFNSVTTPQTILGARFGATAGLTIDQAHHIRFGGTVMQEYGSEFGFDKATPYAYYYYDGMPSEFVFGIFPRKMLSTYPRALLTDTLYFYRPQVEGALFRLKGAFGEQSLWLDWTSRQTDTNRETFLFGFDGTLVYKSLFMRHTFLYYHFAGPAVRIPGDHVRDNGGGSLAAGVTMQKLWLFDTLQVAMGGLGSYDRTRGVTDWQSSAGATALLYMSAPRFSLRYEHYWGESHKLDWGDRFFKAKQYGRLDMGVIPILHRNITARFIYSLHIIESKLDHQQAFFVSADIGGKLAGWSSKHNSSEE